jgi:hypothetical protein
MWRHSHDAPKYTTGALAVAHYTIEASGQPGLDPADHLQLWSFEAVVL